MLKAQFEKTIYHPGETATFLMSADAGDAEVSPQDVIGDCFMQVTVRCKNKSQVFTKTVDSISMGKLEKGFESGTLTMNPVIRVPMDEMTTIGRMVVAQFYLRARAVMDMCCQDNPTISLKILVCGLPPIQERPNYIKQFHTPPGWQAQPQIMPPFVMQLNSHANMYPNYYQQAIDNNQQSVNPMLMNAPNDVPDPQAQQKMAQEGENQPQNGVNKSGVLMGLIARNIKNKPVHPMELYDTNYQHAPGDNGVEQGEEGPLGNKEMAHHVMLEEQEKEKKRIEKIEQKEIKKANERNNQDQEQTPMIQPSQPEQNQEQVVQEPQIEVQQQEGEIESEDDNSSYDDSSSDIIRKEKAANEKKMKKEAQGEGGEMQLEGGGGEMQLEVEA